MNTTFKTKAFTVFFLLLAVFAFYKAITPTQAEALLIEKAHLISSNSQLYEKNQLLIDQANKVLSEATQKRDQAEADNIKLRSELQTTAQNIDTKPKATGATPASDTSGNGGKL